MKLSIICPVYNEAEHIRNLIESLSKDPAEKEIILADGGSTDGTLQILESLKGSYPGIVVVHNLQRYTSHAFNVAYKIARGEYIAFIGAHAEYAPDYFSNGIKYLEKGECDAVGGPLLQTGRTGMGKAIAAAMSQKFGVGNTAFRTMKKKMFVDSVAFAIYRRKVFETAGVMDESLLVNQDDEFHYRLKKYGFRILMVPEMQAVYYVRESLYGLFSQYFRYGLYKPAVLRKVPSGMKLRHLMPAAFITYLATVPLAVVYPLWAIPLMIYSLADIAASLFNSHSLKIKLRLLFIFPVIHLAYGAGLLAGMFRLSK